MKTVMREARQDDSCSALEKRAWRGPQRDPRPVSSGSPDRQTALSPPVIRSMISASVSSSDDDPIDASHSAAD